MARRQAVVRGFWLYGETDVLGNPETIFAEDVTEAAHTIARHHAGLDKRVERERWIRWNLVRGFEIHPYSRPKERPKDRYFWATSWEEAVARFPGEEVVRGTHYDCLCYLDDKTLCRLGSYLWSWEMHSRMCLFMVNRQRKYGRETSLNMPLTMTQKQSIAAGIMLATLDRRFGVVEGRGTGKAKGGGGNKTLRDRMYALHGNDVAQKAIDDMIAVGAKEVLDPWPPELRYALGLFCDAYGETNLTWRQQKALWEGGRKGLSEATRQRLLYGDLE